MMEAIIKKITNLIEQEIRPYVVSHQGDIIFRDYKNEIVYVTLTGSCVGCPFSQLTLKLGVLEMLQKHIPEIKDIKLVE